METEQAQTEQLIRLGKNIKRTNVWVVVIMALYLLGGVLLFSSCERETLPDKPITVQVQTQGLITQSLTKSFSVSEWVYNYNPSQYELKFLGTNGNVYTYNKSIAELKAGFNITVIPDTYNVTYQSEHIGDNGTFISKTLDIKIEDVKNINTVTPVTLTANNDDFLIIVDINNVTQAKIMRNGIYSNIMFDSPDASKNYKYAYYNEVGNVIISYWTGQEYTKTINNAQLNNIYHLVSSFNGSSNINILPFKYNAIGW